MYNLPEVEEDGEWDAEGRQGEAEADDFHDASAQGDVELRLAGRRERTETRETLVLGVESIDWLCSDHQETFASLVSV